MPSLVFRFPSPPRNNISYAGRAKNYRILPLRHQAYRTYTWPLTISDETPNQLGVPWHSTSQSIECCFHFSVIAKIILSMPDILSSCQTFFPADDWQISVVILVFLVEHFMCIQPCWTKCLARSDLSVGHQQKSAGHVRHISQSLIFSSMYCRL